MKLEIPPGCKELHHEVELAVIIGKSGRDIPASSAMSHVVGYTVALDMTARDWQDEAKKKGLPWDAAKGFDTSCALGSFIEKSKVSDPHNLNVWLKINGETKQNGNTKQMIFQIPSLIEHVSSIMTLEEGDIILTGTPSGVGPVLPGQTITAGVESVGELEFSVIHRAKL
jgi:acylpyruvate hydrolase